MARRGSCRNRAICAKVEVVKCFEWWLYIHGQGLAGGLLSSFGLLKGQGQSVGGVTHKAEIEASI